MYTIYSENLILQTQFPGVFIAALVIYFYPSYVIIDPICTFVFSVLVLLTTIKILKDTLNVLLEATPKGIDFEVGIFISSSQNLKQIWFFFMFDLFFFSYNLYFQISLNSSTFQIFTLFLHLPFIYSLCCFINLIQNIRNKAESLGLSTFKTMQLKWKTHGL